MFLYWLLWPYYFLFIVFQYLYLWFGSGWTPAVILNSLPVLMKYCQWQWFGLWTWHIKPDSWFCQTLIHVKGSSDEFIDANIQLVLAVVRKLQERKETKAYIVRRGSPSFIWIFVTFHLKQWGLTRHPNFRFFLISQKSAGPLRFSKQHLTQ